MPNINVNQLTVGQTVLVRGNVSFARLKTKIEGEELQQDNLRKQRIGRQPVDRPYTTVTLSNARIVPKKAQLDLEEQYIQEHFYKKKGEEMNPQAPYFFSKDNVSPYDNTFYLATEKPTGGFDATPFTPTGEFAQGTELILILRVIQSKRGNNKGVVLNGVMVVGEPTYFVGRGNQDLEAIGITIHEAPAAADIPDVPATNQVADPEPGTAFQSQPQTTVNQAAATSTEPAGAWTCSNCGATNAANTVFCGGCGHQKDSIPAPIGGGNPYQQQAGIRPDSN